MGVLFDMRAFFRWLEEASDRELSERHELVLRFSEKVRARVFAKNRATFCVKWRRKFWLVL